MLIVVAAVVVVAAAVVVDPGLAISQAPVGERSFSCTKLTALH